MNRLRIESIDDPRLDAFRSMKKSNSTRSQNTFIAEGTTLVERLFRSPYEVQTVLASTQKLGNFADRIPEGTTVLELDRDLATQLVGYSFHLGVVAVAARKPSPAIADTVPPDGASLVLVAEHMIDQQNVGLLIRIASAFGADAVVLGAGSADGFSRRVLRVSTGNGLFMPIVEGIAAGPVVDDLKSLNYTCCATVLAENATELSNYSFPARTALVFGNETHGLTAEIAGSCDERLTISMHNDTDSVNVAIAAGIFCHSYRSQH